MKEDLVKIIPKPKPKMAYNLVFILWISIILLIALLVLVFFFQQRIVSLEHRKENIEQEIKSYEAQTELEKKLQATSNKIIAFFDLLKEHKRPTQFNNFLENSCHKQVSFFSLRINTKTNNAVLLGETENLRSLGEQILIFKQSEFVKGLKVFNMALNRQGKVNFNLAITFSNDLMKK